jgi:hypothetical protein
MWVDMKSRPKSLDVAQSHSPLINRGYKLGYIV